MGSTGGQETETDRDEWTGESGPSGEGAAEEDGGRKKGGEKRRWSKRVSNFPTNG